MTVQMCCSELNVKASSSFASWADHLLLFVWSTVISQKNSDQRFTLFDWPSCINCLPFPHVHTTAQLNFWPSILKKFGPANSHPSHSLPLLPLQQSFLGIWNTAVCSSMAFLYFEERPSSCPEKLDHHSCPFHRAYCYPALDLCSELWEENLIISY